MNMHAALTDRLPPLPSLRALTRELRDLHEAWSHPEAGGEYVRLVCEEDWDGHIVHVHWRVCAAGQIDNLRIAHIGAGPDGRGRACVYGWEYIPGDGAPFDAVAAARRLLAAAQDD
jgi:hypothetical protein